MAGKPSKASNEQAQLLSAAARECVRSPTHSLTPHDALRPLSDPADNLGARCVCMRAAPPYTELPSSNQPGGSSAQQQQQQQQQHQRYPSGPTAFSSLPPPGPALHAQADSQYAYLTARAAASRADRRAARRLCGAFCWAIVLWMIMGAVVGGVVGNEVARRSQEEEQHRHHRRPQRWRQQGWQMLRAQRVSAPCSCDLCTLLTWLARDTL